MNGAHLHLLLNHLPMIILFVGIIQFALAFWQKNITLQKASLWIFVASALITIPTYLTGENAESIVENMPGVTKVLIHAHESPAFYALSGAIALGLLSAFILWSKRNAEVWSGWPIYTALVLSLIVAGLLGYTSSLGGNISHEELRPGFQAPQ